MCRNRKHVDWEQGGTLILVDKWHESARYFPSMGPFLHDQICLCCRMGLDPETLEETFGAHFGDGAELLLLNAEEKMTSTDAT